MEHYLVSLYGTLKIREKCVEHYLVSLYDTLQGRVGLRGEPWKAKTEVTACYHPCININHMVCGN